MASLEVRADRYRIVFRYGGQKFHHSLKTADRKEAEGCVARLEENLRLLERGRLQPPEDADLPTFLLSDGKVAAKPKIVAVGFTLEEFFKRYVEVHSNGALERSSLETVEMHLRHFRKTLGDRFKVRTLRQEDLQSHLTRRSKQDGFRKRKISPVTLRKEVASFRACWNWGVQSGLLNGIFPNKGLCYPKPCEKPPFQTWAEIERRIARGGLSEVEQQEMWDCLFLTLPEIEELLRYVEPVARHDFVYPMFVFAAHTGARRSEMLRARIDDVDLNGGTVLLREKKRDRSQATHRRATLSPFLEAVLRDWISRHPGGQYLFCLGPEVIRSKKQRTPLAPLTRNEATDHFKRTVAGSKWEKLRGWHVFRHSFVSNCAAKGVDQRMIDAWVGHQTEEMRKRYRHLFPDQQRQAIQSVFGQG